MGSNRLYIIICLLGTFLVRPRADPLARLLSASEPGTVRAADQEGRHLAPVWPSTCRPLGRSVQSETLQTSIVGDDRIDKSEWIRSIGSKRLNPIGWTQTIGSNRSDPVDWIQSTGFSDWIQSFGSNRLDPIDWIQQFSARALVVF